MRRKIFLFLAILPLAMLTSLPCPVKQNVKQLLGVPPGFSLQVERNSPVACNYAPVQYLKSEKSEAKQHHSKIKLLTGEYSLRASVPIGGASYKSIGRDPVFAATIPIFLAFRKLII